MIAIGTRAPDFTLKDQHGKTATLSEFNGRKVLLSFRPLAWTSVCHDQMKLLEALRPDFERLNLIPLGIGIDSVPSNKAWAESMEIKNLRLLSDFWPHGNVAQSFGVFREKDGFSERANIILDEEQKVTFGKVYPTSQLPDFEEILKFLGK